MRRRRVEDEIDAVTLEEEKDCTLHSRPNKEFIAEERKESFFVIHLLISEMKQTAAAL